MSGLAEFIESKNEEIVQRWADGLYQSAVPESLARDEVIDSLREFLDELASALRREGETREARGLARPSKTAAAHGAQRFGLGFDIASVVREYGLLRDVLFQLVEESGLETSARELRILSKYLIGGIADAAARYGHDRDELLRKETEKHVAFLAHELRNPLSSVRLAFEVMRQRGDIAPSRSLEVMERGLQKLSQLIDDALLEIRVKNGGELRPERLPLQEFLGNLAAECAAEVAGKGQTLSVRVDEALHVEADRRLLGSAASNLLRNAVKFSREGGVIHLRARRAQDRILIDVEDECGGLPAGAVQKLFDPFVQIGNDRSGFGLGLAIAKQAMDAHGGQLRVHSLDGKGCVFTLDLPAEAGLR